MLLRFEVIVGGGDAAGPDPRKGPTLHACITTAPVHDDNYCPGEILTAGRSGCSVTLDDKCVSKKHLSIRLLSNKKIVADGVQFLEQAGGARPGFGSPETPEERRACETSPSGIACVVKDTSKFGTFVSLSKESLGEVQLNADPREQENSGAESDTDDEGAPATLRSYIEPSEFQRAALDLFEKETDATSEEAPRFEMIEQNKPILLLPLSHSNEARPQVTILLGTKGSAIRLSLVPLHFALSQYTPADIIAPLHVLGASLSEHWNQRSTHLMAPSKTQSVETLLAVLSGKPIVTKEYASALLRRSSPDDPLPSEEEFRGHAQCEQKKLQGDGSDGPKQTKKKKRGKPNAQKKKKKQEEERSESELSDDSDEEPEKDLPPFSTKAKFTMEAAQACLDSERQSFGALAALFRETNGAKFVAGNTKLLRVAQLQIETAFLPGKNNLSKIPQIAKNLMVVLESLSQTKKMLARSLDHDNIDFTARNTSVASILCRIEALDNASTSEGGDEVTLFLAKAKAAIADFNSKQVDELCLDDIQDFVRMGHPTRNLITHLLNLYIIHDVVSSMPLFTLFSLFSEMNEQGEEYKCLAMDLSESVSPDFVLDGTTSTLDFMENIVRPGLQMADQKEASKDMVCDIRKSLTRTRGPGRSEMLRRFYTESGSKSVLGTRIEGQYDYCGGTDNSHTQRRTNMVTLFFDLFLQEQVLQCLPNDLFAERRYVPSILRAGITKVKSYCNFPRKGFLETVHTSDSKIVEDIKDEIMSRCIAPQHRRHPRTTAARCAQMLADGVA